MLRVRTFVHLFVGHYTRRERVDRKAVKFSELQPVTIHFDGSMDRRVVDGDREYSMDLWHARPGDIIVAKIDLKNGAAGIVPPDWTNVVVTGHFAVYKPDRTRLVPEYLHRLIQTTFFKEHLWRNKVGAEGRKEVKLDFFEQEIIPIPSLAIQQKIVDGWHRAENEMRVSTQCVERKRADIRRCALASLGLKLPQNESLPKVFAVRWQDATRWSVSYNQQVQAGMDLTHGRYPVAALGSVLKMVQYGTSQKANSDGCGAPILRINNVKDGQIDTGDLKHLDLTEKELQNLRLEDGDILIIRTSGSRDLVGTCAVFHGSDPYAFASYLIRLRVDPLQADPDYLAWVINSPIGRQQVNAISRQIMQNNINSEEIRSLEIPLPPLDVQKKKIMADVQAGLAEIADLRAEANAHAEAARAEVERMIVGAV